MSGTCNTRRRAACDTRVRVLRPEEGRLSSKRIDDARIAQPGKVDQRRGHQRLGAGLGHPIIQVPIDLHVQRPAAVRTLGRERDGSEFWPQAPLHEGSRNRVDGSSRIQCFARIGPEAMRRPRRRHRISPHDRACFVSKQKGQMLFEIVEEGDGSLQRQTH